MLGGIRTRHRKAPFHGARQTWVRRCQNRGLSPAPGRGRGRPAYCPIGIRHGGGENAIWASMRNVETCRGDAKGVSQVEVPQVIEYQCAPRGRIGL